MKQITILMTCLFSIVLGACEPDKGTTTQDNLIGNTTDGIAVSNLDYGNSVIPFPNNILFAGSLDGTINIPVDDANNLADPQVAINGMDGFSTISPISTGFTVAFDEATLLGAVRLFEVTLMGGAVSSVDAELVFGADFGTAQSTATDGSSTLVILPLKPLKPKQSYMPVVTTILKSVDGRDASTSASYSITQILTPLHTTGNSNFLTLSDEQAVSLEPLRQATNAAEAALLIFTTANNPVITSSEIIISWNFTTQSITDVLAQVETDVIATTPAAAFNPTPIVVPGVAADIYVGALTIPYYLTVAAGVNDPTPLGSFWQGMAGSNLAYQTANLSPTVTSTHAIPVLLSTPAGGCGGACPVIIFQHGITQNRTNLLAIADGMAAAGFAVIGIDMPMHGVTGNETDGTAGFKDTVNGERTFDIDLVTQDSAGNIIASIPDGITDSSGRHFINLTNLQNSRDNLRQSVSDLMALRFALAAIDFNAGAADGDLDTTDVKFLGHSLGGIVGLTFLAIDTQGMGDAVIAMAGGGIAKLLDGSASIGPSIAAGLAVNGVIKGTADFEAFLGATQTVIDSGDPINHTAAAATGRGILFYEVVGGLNNNPPSDLVVPNSVPDNNDTNNTVPGLLSGTNPLVGVDSLNPGLGLAHTGVAGLAGPNALALIRFSEGDHGSILSPATSVNVTITMQTDAATFFATGNVSVSIPSVIVEP